MTRIWKAVEITVWVVCSWLCVEIWVGGNVIGAMPSARSGVLRTEPVPVSSLRAPATIAKGDSL